MLQNIVNIPTEEEILQILEHHHRDKSNFRSLINETIRRIKDKSK